MYPTLFTTPGLKRFAEAVDTERQAQLAKWGDQKHPDGTGSLEQQKCAESARSWCQDAFGAGYGTWSDILGEEVAEANAERDPAKLRVELLQIAAVCAAWIYDLDRRQPPCAYCNESIIGEHLGMTPQAGQPGNPVRWHADRVECRRAAGCV